MCVIASNPKFNVMPLQENVTGDQEAFCKPAMRCLKQSKFQDLELSGFIQWHGIAGDRTRLISRFDASWRQSVDGLETIYSKCRYFHY